MLGYVLLSIGKNVSRPWVKGILWIIPKRIYFFLSRAPFNYEIIKSLNDGCLVSGIYECESFALKFRHEPIASKSSPR